MIYASITTSTYGSGDDWCYGTYLYDGDEYRDKAGFEDRQSEFPDYPSNGKPAVMSPMGAGITSRYW